MRLCEDVITVFNARADPARADIAYRPTVLRGASWYATQAEGVDPKGGYLAANKIIIRIPKDADAGGRVYADPTAYRGAEDTDGLWTLNGGDVIVRGAAEGADWTPAKLRAVFPDCMTVLAVTDNRRAAQAPHWKVVGA